MEVDGVLKPGGPTISSMKKTIGSLLGGFTAPTADEVDQHHAQRQQGEYGLLNIRPARLSMPKPTQSIELDEASLAFNRDSANALVGSTVDGQIPDIYGKYLSQAGAAAHPTIMDLAEQVNATSGRDRADRVLHGIIGNASAAQVEGLLGGPQPARRPIGVKLAELTDDGEIPLFRVSQASGDQKKASTERVKQALAEDEPPTPEPSPNPTPTTPPEKPGQGKPESPPENSDCQERYDAFIEAQDERDAAQTELDDIRSTLDEVEAEIEDIRQQIDDAERLAEEGAGRGWEEGKIIDFSPMGKVGGIIGRVNKPRQLSGALKESREAMEYLTSVLYPKRRELEGARQDLLKQVAAAEKVLAKAQDALDQAAEAYRQCRGDDEQ